MPSGLTRTRKIIKELEEQGGQDAAIRALNSCVNQAVSLAKHPFLWVKVEVDENGADILLQMLYRDKMKKRISGIQVQNISWDKTPDLPHEVKEAMETIHNFMKPEENNA